MTQSRAPPPLTFVALIAVSAVVSLPKDSKIKDGILVCQSQRHKLISSKFAFQTWQFIHVI